MKKRQKNYERPKVKVLRVMPCMLLDASLEVGNGDTVEQYSKRNDMFDTDIEEEIDY